MLRGCDSYAEGGVWRGQELAIRKSGSGHQVIGLTGHDRSNGRRTNLRPVLHLDPVLFREWLDGHLLALARLGLHWQSFLSPRRWTGGVNLCRRFARIPL